MIHFRNPKSDWTRLYPRPKDCTDQARVIYLFEFLRHKRGSEASKEKAFKELLSLSNYR